MDKEPREAVKAVGMSNNGTDPILISRQFQRMQERRMYLSQQQYGRESEESLKNVPNHGHGSVLVNMLSSEQYNKTVQRPVQNTSLSVHPNTIAQDSGTTSANTAIQVMTLSSGGTLRPATSNSQETATNDQVNRRHELLVEVLSQFERRTSVEQNTNVGCSKRQLDSNNGVAFDWGKLPRIGTVHSVKGIMGPENVKTSSGVGSKESNSEAPSSRIGKIKMAELARLILNGTFDNLLSGSSPGEQSAGNLKTTASGLNGAAQGNEKDSSQVSGEAERQVFDSRVGSSSQDMAVNSVPVNDSHSYRENTQLETTANQRVPSFNQSSSNLNTSGSFDLQSNQRTSYNTIYPYCTTSGRYNLQSNQRTSYNTNNGNVNAAGCYDTQSNRRPNNNVNAGNMTSNANYVPQLNQRTSYNAGTPNRTASASYGRQSNQRTSYGTSFNHQNLSHMTHGQTSGVYGRTPVRISQPRSVCSVASTPSLNSSSSYVPRRLTSIPVALSNPPAGSSLNINYRRYTYPHNQNFQFINRAVRTARVEPLSNHTHPSPRATHVTTSNTSTSSTATASSPGSDLSKNAQHDENSCLDCKLLGTGCPIRKALATDDLASEKEKGLKDSSDEEPDLIITKVTTKDAERGPIERIDVDEWVASSAASVSETFKVKQEPVDKEEVAPNHEEKNSQINNIVNQMRLMAERLLTDDGVLDLGTATADRNEQNASDKNLTSNSISVQDSVGDSNAVDEQQVTVSEVVSAQPTSNATAERGVRDDIMQTSASVSQECDSSAVRDDATTDKVIASEVAEKSIIEDGVTEGITSTQSAFDITEKSIAQDSVTIDIQTASEVRDERFAQDPVTMDTQTVSEAREERFTQDPVTKDLQPVSESIQGNLNQGHIADNMNTGKENTCGVADDDQDAGATRRNDTDQTSVGTTGHHTRPLASLTKNIKSIESCISFLKQRANGSYAGPAESEYDIGDRNYQKYVSMEGRELADQGNDSTAMNTESIGNSETNRTISRQPPRTPIEMSSSDKQALEHLERQLEENQEKLKSQNDVRIRIRYLKERLFILKQTKRIGQKYELMSFQDREAINKLERALERNQEKLKNQNIEWIRKNCRKARLIIFKKIERIRSNYGLPPEDPSFVFEDLENRNEDNLNTMQNLEPEAASEVNTVPSANHAPLGTVPDQENVCELTNNTAADSLQMPKTSADNQETHRLSSETPNQEAEEVTREEESTLDTLGIGLDNRVDIEEQDPVSSEEIPPLADPSTNNGLLGIGLDNRVDIEEQDPVSSKEIPPLADPSTNNGLLGNVVVKTEGIQRSDLEDAITLEDAIKTFVEKPQDRQDETADGKTSTSNQCEGSPTLQNHNQENSTRFSFPDRREQVQPDKSALEKPTTNLLTEILPLITDCDESVEKIPVNGCEVQSDHLLDIQDLSNEITIAVVDRSVQTERNHALRKKCPRCLRTDQCEESANCANAAAESPVSKNIVRKEKRKLDVRDEHVLIKKEKIDSDQENTPQKEKNNIWDFIKRYSLS